LIGLTLDPVEFIMERKMMCGIKERAEAASEILDVAATVSRIGGCTAVQLF